MSAAGKLGWGHYVIQSPSLPTWAVGVKFVKEKPNLLKGATGKRESPREQSLLRKLCANPTCVCVRARVLEGRVARPRRSAWNFFPDKALAAQLFTFHKVNFKTPLSHRPFDVTANVGAPSIASPPP